MAEATVATVAWAFLGALVISASVVTLWMAVVRYRRKDAWERRWLRSLFRNKDGYPSLGKFQFLVWTVVILPVFTWIYLIRLLSGVLTSIGDFPESILALVGISVATTPASDIISARLYPEDETEPPEKTPPLRRMLEENKQLSLARFQMFIWTFVSVTIYILVVLRTLTLPETLNAVENLTLPDIDPALVVLMGLSQTGYIGAKAARLSEKEAVKKAAAERKTKSAKGAASEQLSGSPPPPRS